MPKSSELLLFTKLNYHKYFLSYETICTTLSLKTTLKSAILKIRHFESSKNIHEGHVVSKSFKNIIREK